MKAMASWGCERNLQRRGTSPQNCCVLVVQTGDLGVVCRCHTAAIPALDLCT